MPLHAQFVYAAAVAALTAGPFAVAQDLNFNGVEDADEFGLAIPGSYGPEFVEDFESPGLPVGWTATGLWNVTSLCGSTDGLCDPSSTQYAYYGDTATCTFETGARTFGSLASPEFSFPDIARFAQFTYCSRYEGEGGAFVDIAEVRLNNITRGTFVVIDSPSFSPFSGGWEERRAIISDSVLFPGEVYTLSFYFDSDDEIGNAFLGWQVDNLELTASTSVDRNENGVPDEVEISEYDKALSGTIDFETGDFTQFGEFSTGDSFYSPGSFSGLNALEWVVTSNCAAPGSPTAGPQSFSAYFGDPTTCNFSTANQEAASFAITVELNADADPMLRFSSRYEGEAGEYSGEYDPVSNTFLPVPGSNFDVAGVSVYSYNSLTFITPDVFLSVSSASNLGEWQDFELDLSALPSGDYLIYFAFNSVDGTANDFLGWQVDNIRIVTDNPNRDLNRNGRPDDTDSFAYNATDDEVFSSIFDAVSDSDFSQQDAIIVSSGLFVNRGFQEIPTDTSVRNLSRTAVFGDDPSDRSVNFTVDSAELFLSDGAILSSPFGQNPVVDGGALIVDTGSRATIADTLVMRGDSRLELRAGSTLQLSFIGIDEGTFDIQGAVFDASPFDPVLGTNAPGAEPLTINAWGTLQGQYVLAQNATTNILADLQVTDTLANEGVINIQNGTLSVVGGLTNSGTINGQTFTPIDGGRSTPNSLFSPGDITLAADSSFLANAPTFTLNVGGDVDIQINDNDRFAMGASELRLNAVGSQTFEAMSRDRGAVLDGLDASLDGSFPIGTLRVGPLATTATLVDNNDNDPANANPEVIYATNVIVEPGATLNLTDHVVYYENAQVLGTVINPGNLIEIEPMLPCPTDLTGDGTTDISDLLQLLAVFNTASASGDITGDGQSDISDLLQLLTQFNTACP